MADDATRDRVRALVRDVLSKTMPAEAEPDEAKPAGVSPPLNSSNAVTRDESAKLVITEDDVRGLEHGAVLRIAEAARLTPLAADIVNERGIELVRRVPRRGSQQSKTVAVGADHGGYPMKEELKIFLAQLGHRVHDFGTNSESAVDYPDFAHAVARGVADGTAEVGIVTLASTMARTCSRSAARPSRANRCAKLSAPGSAPNSPKTGIANASARSKRSSGNIRGKVWTLRKESFSQPAKQAEYQ
jgi:RpiB/LacA/LacB family sugar-phosphate isomerase